MKSKPYTGLIIALLLLGVACVLGLALAQGTALSVRWTVYLFIVPFAMVILTQVRSSYILFLALLGPLILLENSLISMRPLGPIYVGLSLPLTLLLLGIGWSRNAVPLPDSKIILLWLVIIALAGIGLGRETENLQMAGRLYQTLYIQGGLLLLLGRVLITGVGDLENLAKALITVALICAMLQLLFLRTGVPYLQPTYNEFQLGQATWRYGGPLGNPNSLANLFAISGSLLLLLFFDTKNRVRRYLIGALGVTLISATFITGSRGGNISMLFGLICVLAFIRGRSPWRVWALPLLAVTALLAAQAIFPETMNKSFERLTGASDTVRMEIWAATVELLAEFPMGVGLTSEVYATELNRIRPGFFYANPHSIYLSVIVHMGFLGFLTMATLVGRGLSDGLLTVRLSGIKSFRPLYAIPAIGLLVFLCGGITEPLFSNGHKLNNVFWLLLGASTRIPELVRTPRTTEPVK